MLTCENEKVTDDDRAHKQWPAYLRQLISQCLDIAFEPLRNQPDEGIPFYCPDGQYRDCRLLLAGWIADYKEQVGPSSLFPSRFHEAIVVP